MIKQLKRSDITDEVTKDSSTLTDDTPDMNGPREAANNRDGDKQDIPQVPGGEKCEELCIKESELESHKQHTWNDDNENGEKAEGGINTIATQTAKESDCTSPDQGYDSRMKPVTARI